MSLHSRNSMESEPSTHSYTTSSAPSTSTVQWSQPCRVFEFSEILSATENFDESLVIGHGGFGKVYKGKVTIASTRVIAAAIKRLDLRSNQGEIEFWAEVEMLSKLRHCHLVSLIGYCNHQREMILVYEYIPHGTLEDHLHKLRTPLSWLERLKICIGAARGLDYLHTGTGIEFGVIHRDVKTSNILLHASWAAKISDFGLSKIGPINQPTTYVKTLVKGTFGYLDPNYFATGKLTRKSDVYAFGVVLFEVLCQKRPVDKSLEWGLATWAQDAIKEGNLKHIIDSDIRDEISPKSLKEFSRIAQRCLDNHPKRRPTMGEVIFSLESALNIQQKTNTSVKTSRKTIFGRMVGVFPFTSIGDNSGMGFRFLTSKKKKQIMLKKKFLEQNGALLLEDKLKTMGIGSIKIFGVEELEEATNNYASNMIIGRGGYGTVYKGILRDMRVVAIKKSQMRHVDQMEQFLNEVVVLGQINHENVVQLLGCCLETEVPLLAFEFVPNGTLYQHIHNETNGRGRLSWDSRLRIANESARALAYLHTMSIIHRDVKSTNILLDENYTAKMADFGASRLLPFDRDEVTTQVVGTLGYLDPEYYHTSQLTNKSDVYSFGVVLVELFTGKKLFDPERCQQERNLASYFVMTTMENRLSYIVDNLMLGEATNEQIKGACDLIYRCLNLVGEKRPSMKDVAMELETLRNLNYHDWFSQDNYNQSETFVESEQFDHDDIISNASYASASETLEEQSPDNTAMN